jgi:hypothetical protein
VNSLARRLGSDVPWPWRATLGATVPFLLWAVTAAATRCDDPASCLQTIEERQRATQSLSARFVQTKRLSLMNEPLVSTGRFAFKQPDQMLWQIDDPRVTVRIDEQGIHLPGLAHGEQADLAPFSKVLREISGLFTGSWSSIQANFDVEVEPNEARVRVHLVPRSDEWRRLFRSMDLSFARPELMLQTIRLEEALGDSVEIVFSDVHRNDAVAAAAFEGAP